MCGSGFRILIKIVMWGLHAMAMHGSGVHPSVYFAGVVGIIVTLRIYGQLIGAKVVRPMERILGVVFGWRGSMTIQR
jgi:hypothetical protein